MTWIQPRHSLDLAREPQIHRTLTGFGLLLREETGEVKRWLTVLQVGFQEKQTLRRRYECGKFTGESSKGQGLWESERSSTGQREMVNGHAAGTTWHWYGLSESAPIRPTSRELSPWLWLVIVCRLPRTGAWSWARCLSSIKCNSQRGSEPSGQPPTLPKLREEGWVWVWVEQHSVHKSWASGLSEWLWGHRYLQLKWGNEEEQMDSGRTDFILNWWHLNTWEDVPRDPERHQSGNDGNENHSWWTPGKREYRSTETARIELEELPERKGNRRRKGTHGRRNEDQLKR